MKLNKIVSVATASSLISMALSGVAFADSCSISVTGQGSTNNCSTTETVTVNETNLNNVTVNNVNTQVAVSGPATSSNNTVGGSASTGSVSNNNSTTTVVTIGNSGLGGGLVGGVGGNTGGSNVGGGSAAAAGSNVGGGSLALAGVGGGSLPNTGATGPVDVSALTSLFNPSTQAGDLAKQTQNTSRALLALGALLSLIGAVGSAVYANKKKVTA